MNTKRPAGRRQRICRILSLILLLAALFLEILYFLRILSHHASTFAWCLIAPTFLIESYASWQTDRENAVRNLCIGCFITVAALIGLCGFLMTI